MHPHRDIGVITVDVEGRAQATAISMGNGGDVAAGEVQPMVPGSGVVHARYPRRRATAAVAESGLNRPGTAAPRAYEQEALAFGPTTGTLLLDRRPARGRWAFDRPVRLLRAGHAAGQPGWACPAGWPQVLELIDGSVRLDSGRAWAVRDSLGLCGGSGSPHQRSRRGLTAEAAGADLCCSNLA